MEKIARGYVVVLMCKKYLNTEVNEDAKRNCGQGNIIWEVSNFFSYNEFWEA
jgi:hypothetical protein